ncbi:MAG: hypothetical protein R3C32_02570 [Chloroflexota bacterium]
MPSAIDAGRDGLELVDGHDGAAVTSTGLGASSLLDGPFRDALLELPVEHEVQDEHGDRGEETAAATSSCGVLYGR